ncbi:MAG: hypothetical protein GYA14_12790, partial [Ignavibacteria bacterium]|nr:hypothetical protein [Ignavibacteria bacterium]
MKGFILFILAVLICFSSFTYAQLSGNKYIGTGGDYTTFAIACSTLNADGVGAGGVTFIIYTGTYTESAPLSIDIATNKPTSENPVTFKPDVGATVVLNVGGQLTGSRWAIRIGTSANTVDYVTLDGSNSLGGTTRDWTIKSTAATYGIEPIDIYGDYCTVKNCIIDMNNGGYSGSGFGITLREATPTSNFCTIQNNYIKGNNGISVGRNTTVEQEGHLIKGNEIHSLNRGIYVYRSKNIIIEENEIIGDAYSGYPAGACYGIYTASASGNTGELVIRNNIIRNLGSNSGTIAAQTIRCINPSGPGTYKIYGNKIY